jgi:hypothetical protein
MCEYFSQRNIADLSHASGPHFICCRNQVDSLRTTLHSPLLVQMREESWSCDIDRFSVASSWVFVKMFQSGNVWSEKHNLQLENDCWSTAMTPFSASYYVRGVIPHCRLLLNCRTNRSLQLSLPRRTKRNLSTDL